MKAKDVMTAPVQTIGQDETVLEAIRQMLQLKISGMPVVDAAGKLVGMVTEGDFLRRSELGTEQHAPRWIEFLMSAGSLADRYVHANGRRIRDVMTDTVIFVPDDAPLSDVVETMERNHVKRVPVLKNGKLAGIITRANLLRAIAGQTRDARPAPAADEAIRTALLAKLKQESWAPLTMIDVTVVGGVVKLSGAILDERQRGALRVAAENIPGVVSVVDEMVWIEPMSGTVIPAQALT